MSYTPDGFRRARERLGLTLERFAEVLGYEGTGRRVMAHRLETSGPDGVGLRELREPQRRLIDAYLSGYRPKDWPSE